MAKRTDNSGQVVAALVAGFGKLPTKAKIGLVVAVLVVGGIALATGAFKKAEPPAPPAQTEKPQDPKTDDPDTPPEDPAQPLVNLPPPPAAFPARSRPIVFCFWNVENLFDDIDDKRRSVDEPYDKWFVDDADTRKKKFDRLTEVLLKLNDGKGPDVLACCEVESGRAAEMLKDALNAALPPGAEKYTHVAMKNLDAGRHIAPCVISRIPIDSQYTRLIGSRQRILQVWLKANGHDLCVVASHWTSQITDDGKSTENKGRAKYATTIHDLYTAELKKNPKLDFLVCGDFNDPPEADSVRNKLHLTGDAKLVTADANPPRLFGLLSGKNSSEFGTHYYRKPLIYDHIGLSPGMFDSTGWGYDPDSVRVPAELMMRSKASRIPWRFGSATDNAAGRGYSDHFPVVVTLRVAP